MPKQPSSFYILSLFLAVLLVGCAAPAPAPTVVTTRPAPVQPPAPAPLPPTPPPAPKPAEPSASEKALETALASFERGDYPTAIRLLTPLTSDSSLSNANQLTAMKTMAFAHCLSRATVTCRQTFERAFKQDSKFDLAPAERGHPIWGPQFERARKAVTGQ
jgi:hypothetical protein